VSMVFSKETLDEYFHRELRWSIALKSARPSGYRAMLFTHGLPWAAVGAAASLSIGSLPLAASYLVAYLVLRLAVTWLTGAWGLRDPALSKMIWLVPVRDAVSFVVWVAGFFSERIVWRGIEYRMHRGELIPFPSTSAAIAAPRESVSSVVG